MSNQPQYFAQCTSNTEAKALYRKLAKELHPDKPTGSELEFKKLTAQYAQYLQGHNKTITRAQALNVIKNVLDGVDNKEFEGYIQMLQDMYPDIKILQHAKKTMTVIKLINQLI